MKAAQSKPQKLFLLQVIFATAFIALTSGVFLNGFALYLGAGDMLISYISVIPNVCGILVLGFITRIDRLKSRKRATIMLIAASRLTALSIILIPFLAKKPIHLPLFIAIVLTTFTLQALAAVSLNNWLAYFTPDTVRGRYIGMRQSIYFAVVVVTALSGGRFLDFMGGKYIGFFILFSIALLMFIWELLILCKIEDVSISTLSPVRYKIKDIFKIVSEKKEFIRYLVYVFFFYLVLYISSSFTGVYLLRYLNLSFSAIAMFNLIVSLPQIFLTAVWGRISDKRGHHAMLVTSIWFFIGEGLFIFLTSPSTMYICIPIAFLISSVANSGFGITVFNTRFALLPEEGRMLYDSFYSAVIGIAFIIGPLIGGLLKNFIAEHTQLGERMVFAEIRVLYLISAVLIVILQLVYLFYYRRKRTSLH